MHLDIKNKRIYFVLRSVLHKIFALEKENTSLFARLTKFFIIFAAVNQFL